MPEETLVTKGLIERIGIKDSIFTIEVNGEKIKDVKDIKDHEEAINIMLDSFKQHGIIDDINDIAVQDIVSCTVVSYSQRLH